MKRRTVALTSVVVMMFLMPAFSNPLDATAKLNPESSLYGKTSLLFKQKYDIVSIGLLLYKLDAVERASKEVVRETMMRQYERALMNLSGVTFDLKNMDIGKKGWTRYYPFNVRGESYILRIFKTDEAGYQPEVKVLYEGTVTSPEVTFQILPGVNALLEDCVIKPSRIELNNPSARCP